MAINLSHAWPSVTAAFLASIVEFVEALTVILAVGTVRGWRSSLAGAAGAVVVLLAMILALGPALTQIPLRAVQVFVGALILLFGLRWLRKAVLRSAGVIPLHDEAAAYATESALMRQHGERRAGWDAVAIATSFKITLLEGVEVVFIVIAVGAGGAGLLVPAGLGALAALALVVLLGLVIHEPLSRVPENTLKFIVGILLSAFGTFWFGEGIGAVWPTGDLAIVFLALAFATAAVATAVLARGASRPHASISKGV